MEAACRQVAGLELIKVGAATDLPGLAPTMDALVIGDTSYTPDVAAMLKRDATKLRWIHFASAGYDSAIRNGVPSGAIVTNSSPAWAAIVAEHAFALLLGLVRRVAEAERARTQAQWKRPDFLKSVGTLEGKRAVIVGFGNIGREIASRARAFGMSVVGVARQSRTEPLAERIVGPEGLPALLPEADVLIISAPLTAATKGLIGSAALATMKPSALLINVSRGGIIPDSAVLEALTAKRLAGAGLDVFETEPLPADHPLWKLENTIITPHVAGFGSMPGFVRMSEIVRDNATALIAGRPLSHLADLSGG
jgi:phosphoglycerate dehydrogenase-like enzyme